MQHAGQEPPTGPQSARLRTAGPPVLVTAPLMGYGHLRAATAVAEALGTEASRSDRPPLASAAEARTWQKLRRFYERVSRVSQRRYSGYPAQRFLDWITEINPLHPARDQSRPTRSAETMERHAAQGLGRRLVTHVESENATLVSAFYAEALAAARVGWPRVFCVVTDSDVNRVWAPFRPAGTTIRYMVPAHRVARRLEAYGVPPQNVEVTGFPLPPSLVGEDGGVLRRTFAERVVRLDPAGTLRQRLDAKGLRVLLPQPRKAPDAPPLVLFAVGGAGAQTALAERILAGLKPLLVAGRIRLALAAGVRAEVAESLARSTARVGLDPRGAHVQILHQPDFGSYYEAFNELLTEVDVLWTKPSELVFYAALGLPLLLAPPVGVQERANERWVLSRGAALRQGRPEHAHSWLREMLEDGLLAGAAWSGYVRLPHDGAYRIRDAVLAASEGSR